MSDPAGSLLGGTPSKATPAAGSLRRRPAVHDYSDWRAEDYFDTYYGERVLPDEQRVLAYELGVLEREPRTFGHALDYGCGPTLHRAIAASRYVLRIDLADRIAGNLAQIAAWLKASPANADWHRFTRHILAWESERKVDTRRIERREALARRVIRRLYVSDARWTNPLGLERRGFYDLLISGFCVDAVSQDKRVWRACMRNMLSMLSEGGLLILHALGRCSAYRVGNRLYPNADLSKDDVYASLVANDFIRATIDIEAVPCPENAHYGYSHVLMASGRRAWRRVRARRPRRSKLMIS